MWHKLILEQRGLVTQMGSLAPIMHLSSARSCHISTPRRPERINILATPLQKQV